jgi:hypothetical protein
MARPGLRGWGELAAALGIAGLAVALVRFAGPPIYCGDGFFHIRVADVIRHEGLAQSLPAFQEALPRDDLNLLYHLLLIPFTFGDLLRGAQWAGIAGGALAAAAFWGALRMLRAPQPLAFTVLLLAACPDLLYRMTFTRPLVLALALAWLGTATVLAGRARLAGGLAFLWAHTHISFHVLPAIALLHDVLREAPEDSGWRRFRTTLWTLGGVVAGVIVSPYFPSNLRFWVTANFGVLDFAWSRLDVARFATEMGAVRTDEFLVAHLGAFAATAVALLLLVWGRRVSDQARTLLLVTLGFFALSLLSQRFAEHWAPFSFMLLAVAVRDTGALGGWSRWLLLPAGLCLLVFTVRLDREAAAAEQVEDYAAASSWMSEHVPLTATLFHPAFDEFAPLYFHEPKRRFLTGMDPTFFMAANRERFDLWGQVVRGQVRDAWEPIRHTFDSRWVFLPRRFVSLRRLLERDPRFVERYRDREAAIYEAADDPGYVGDWTVRGWVEDPTRTWLAGSDGPVASQERELQGISGFLDLRRALGIPWGKRDVCAIAETQVPSTPGAPLTLELFTDDEVRLTWDAGEPLERSPYRDPPAPLNLADLGRVRDGIQVLRAEGTARGPQTAVRIATCQVGDEFGFVVSRLR